MLPVFRPYQQSDLSICLKIFDSNTPPYFDPSERGDFEDFLHRQPCPYFVLEQDGETIACGGYFSNPNGDIVLAWGMVRRDLHKSGFGSLLLKERIQKIRIHDSGHRIVIDTSQHSQGFFCRHGFRSTGITENHYGPGLHRVDMELNP